MKIYIETIPWSMRGKDLQGLFKPLGDINSAPVVTDRQNRRSRRFGFVEMASCRAIDSRQLRVNNAESKQRV